MEITPQDVQQKQFDQVKRGFDPQQVGVFLDQMAATLAKRDHTISEAYARIEKMSATDNAASENQEAFRLTMTVATETMEEMLRTAGERAAQIEEEAREAAEVLVERVRVDSENRVASIKQELESLVNERARLESQIAGLREAAGEATPDAGSPVQPTSGRRSLELVVDRPGEERAADDERSAAGGQSAGGSGLAARVGDLRG